jgi:hypothetical protein
MTPPQALSQSKSYRVPRAAAPKALSEVERAPARQAPPHPIPHALHYSAFTALSRSLSPITTHWPLRIPPHSAPHPSHASHTLRTSSITCAAARQQGNPAHTLFTVDNSPPLSYRLPKPWIAYGRRDKPMTDAFFTHPILNSPYAISQRTYFQSTWANNDAAKPGALRLVSPEHRLA